MTMRKLLIAAIAALGLFGASAPAFAATQVLCSPENPLSAQNRRVVNTASTAATQPSYILNGQGCALIAQADIGFFLSQGFSPGADHNTLLFTSGVQTGTTDLVIGSIPANAYVQQFIVFNATANAITGGLDVGTTANGTDVISALAVGANALVNTADSALLKKVFSTTVATPIHISGHTAWNSANITVTVIYGYF